MKKNVIAAAMAAMGLAMMLTACGGGDSASSASSTSAAFHLCSGRGGWQETDRRDTDVIWCCLRCWGGTGEAGWQHTRWGS